MITLTAKLQAKAGFERDVEQALLAMIPDVQNEEKTLTYTLHRSTDDPSVFLYYEQYIDREAFKFHSSTSYFKKLIAALEGKLSGSPEETFYEVVGSIKR